MESRPDPLRRPRMRRTGLRLRRVWPVLGVLLFASSVVHAQLYRWVDENGKVHYSDSVPPTANDRARKELRADGVVRKETERAATAEEKRQAALRAAEDSKTREQRMEQERKDRALLGTYTDLKDYDRVRDRTMRAIDAEVRYLSDREAILSKIVAGQSPSADELARLSTAYSANNAEAGNAVASPAAAGKPSSPAPATGAPPGKAPPAKSATALLLEAKSELPRVTDLLTRKRRERADQAAVFASERNRLATLIEAENARSAAAAAPASGRR